MDKIYSRTRLKIPNFKNTMHNKQKRKLYTFLAIWIIAIVVLVSSINFVSEPFEKLCIVETKKIGTLILNDVSTKVLRNVDYNDLVIVSKNTEDEITMAKSNVILINILASDIAYKIEQEFSNMDKSDISLPIGVLTGINILAGIGPNIDITVMPVGTVVTKFRSDFLSAGINQTIHRLYLEVKCDVDILTPYGNMGTSIVNEVLFAENIIVGDIPASYYNLEGMTDADIMEVIN